MKAKDAIMCTESTRCTATWIFVAWSYKVFFIAGVCRFIIIFPWKSSRSCPDVWKPEVKVKKKQKIPNTFSNPPGYLWMKKRWKLWPLTSLSSLSLALYWGCSCDGETLRTYGEWIGHRVDITVDRPRPGQADSTGKERGKDVGRFPPWWGERKTPFSWSESAIFVRRVGQFRLRWAFIRDTKFCISQLDWRCLKKVRHYGEIHGFTVLLRVDTTVVSAAAWSVSLA